MRITQPGYLGPAEISMVCPSCGCHFIADTTTGKEAVKHTSMWSRRGAWWCDCPTPGCNTVVTKLIKG